MRRRLLLNFLLRPPYYTTSPAGLTSACHSSIDVAPHQLAEAKADKRTNNNTCANNKQTNQGGTCAGGSAELHGDGVWHAMCQSMWKGFGDVLEIHQKGGKARRLITLGHTLTHLQSVPTMCSSPPLPASYNQMTHHQSTNV